MRRLVTLLVIMGFLSAMLSVATHHHVTSDEQAAVLSCGLCNLATTPGIENAAAELAPHDGEQVLDVPPLLPSTPVVIQVLDFSPNHSPPRA